MKDTGDVNHRLTLLEGDIVVTAMATYFALSRMRPDGKTHEYLGAGENRAMALKLAGELAGAKHRVFLNETARTLHQVQLDCDEIAKESTAIPSR